MHFGPKANYLFIRESLKIKPDVLRVIKFLKTTLTEKPEPVFRVLGIAFQSLKRTMIMHMERRVLILQERLGQY